MTKLCVNRGKEPTLRLQHLPNLVDLKLYNVENIWHPRMITNPESLETLEINPSITSRSFSTINVLSCLSNLRVLELSRCKDFNDLSALLTMPLIEKLVLFQTSNLKDLTFIGTLEHLQHLELSSC